jgi:hypothetical protein
MNELSKSVAELIQSLNGGAKSLAEALQRISPEAWKVTVYQVQINAYRNIIGWWCIAAVCFVIGLKFRQIEKKLRAAKDNEAESYCIVTWVAMCLSLIISFVAVCANIDGIINPQYEAAVKILSHITPTQSGRCR